MSKSVPTGTQQTITQNPLGQAQLPFMQDLWGQAQSLFSSGAGQGNLQSIRDYTGTNFQGALNNARPNDIMPNAMNFANQMFTGQYPQANLPAGPQIGGLGDIAGGAVNTGTGYGQGLSGQALNAINAGLSGRQDLANLAPGAVGTGTGYGGAIANAAYGAPGAVSPFVGGLSGLSGAAQNIANPAMGGLYGNAGMAIGGNPIYDSLRGMASGQYIDPRTNPAYAGTIQAITDPLVRQYQTATAPQTDSGFEGAGRYGSGAMANARNQDQTNLGMGLGGAISNAVNNMYNTGLQSTLGAGSALGSAYNTGTSNISDALARAGALGQSGIQNAGQLLGSAGGLGLSGLQQMMSGLGTAGQTANQGYATGGNILSQSGQLGNQGYATGGQMLANAAQAANQAYGTGTTALGQAGNLANSGALNLGGLAQIAPELANFPTSQLSAGYNTNWLPLQNYAAILGSPQTPNTQSNTSGTQQQNVVSNILGTGLGIASLASKISDRRMKRDIHRVGTLDNGLPVYSFRYLGSGTMEIGVMADEVEALHPDAVTDIGGLKLVDYAKAVLPAADAR